MLFTWLVALVETASVIQLKVGVCALVVKPDNMKTMAK